MLLCIRHQTPIFLVTSVSISKKPRQASHGGPMPSHYTCRRQQAGQYPVSLIHTQPCASCYLPYPVLVFCILKKENPMQPGKPACGCCSRSAAMVRVGWGLGPVALSMRSVKPSTALWRELSKAANCADSMPALTQPGNQPGYHQNVCKLGSGHSWQSIVCERVSGASSKGLLLAFQQGAKQG